MMPALRTAGNHRRYDTADLTVFINRKGGKGSVDGKRKKNDAASRSDVAIPIVVPQRAILLRPRVQFQAKRGFKATNS